jgi:hypothetical protein
MAEYHDRRQAAVCVEWGQSPHMAAARAHDPDASSFSQAACPWQRRRRGGAPAVGQAVAAFRLGANEHGIVVRGVSEQPVVQWPVEPRPSLWLAAPGEREEWQPLADEISRFTAQLEELNQRPLPRADEAAPDRRAASQPERAARGLRRGRRAAPRAGHRGRPGPELGQPDHGTPRRRPAQPGRGDPDPDGSTSDRGQLSIAEACPGQVTVLVITVPQQGPQPVGLRSCHGGQLLVCAQQDAQGLAVAVRTGRGQLAGIELQGRQHRQVRIDRVGLALAAAALRVGCSHSMATSPAAAAARVRPPP